MCNIIMIYHNYLQELLEVFLYIVMIQELFISFIHLVVGESKDTEKIH